LSEVVVLPNQEIEGGYIRPSPAVSGTDVLIASTLGYHFGGEGGFASLRCQARR
jgi:hypothetical protein